MTVQDLVYSQHLGNLAAELHEDHFQEEFGAHPEIASSRRVPETKNYQ